MKNRKKHIYIPIEIFYREFLPRLYLASKAIKKNYRVYLGTKYGIDQILDQKKKLNQFGGIFFYKGNIIQNKSYLGKIMQTCESFVSLDEELGPAVPNKKLSLSIRAVFNKKIKKFFVLSSQWKKRIIQKDKRFKNIIINSGWPKYDLISDKNFSYYLKESKKIRKKFGSFYLFSSNFGTLSNQGLKKMMTNLDNNYSKSFCQKRKKLFEKNLRDFYDFIKELNSYYSNGGKKKIIIRPHPSEFFHHDWKKNTKNIKDKIDVIYENDVIPWIIASDGLIHRGCGTSIDAYILNKKAYYWIPKREIEKYEKNLPYKISKRIKNLKYLENNKKRLNLNKKFLSKEVENFKNINSSEKIVKELDKLNTIIECPLKEDSYAKMKFIFYIIKFKLKNFFLTNVNTKFPKIIEKSLVENFFKDLKIKSKINIKRINSEALEIELIK